MRTDEAYLYDMLNAARDALALPLVMHWRLFRG